jgi:hypothetical protein
MVLRLRPWVRKRPTLRFSDFSYMAGHADDSSRRRPSTRPSLASLMSAIPPPMTAHDSREIRCVYNLGVRVDERAMPVPSWCRTRRNP